MQNERTDSHPIPLPLKLLVAILLLVMSCIPVLPLKQVTEAEFAI